MLNYPVILTVFLLLVSFSPAKGEEVILGTVRSIDRDKGEVVLEVWTSPWEDLNGQSLESGDKNPVVVRISSEDMPNSLLPGSVIRVWGNFVSGNQRMFQASGIRGRPGLPGTVHSPGRPAGTDPTGVRTRLQKGRNSMQRGMGAGGGHSRHR